LEDIKKEKEEVSQERDEMKQYMRLLKNKLDDKTRENGELKR